MARIVKVPTSTTSPRPYEVRWSWYDADGARKFKKERYRTEREAKAKKREVEDSVASASLPDYAGGKLSVAHWAGRWLDKKRALRKPSTVRGYEAIWTASVEPQWGNRRINSITTGDVQDWITELLQRDLKPPTIRHHVWVLGQAFSTAARARAITYNPVRDVELPTDRSVGRLKPEPHFLTAEEVEQIADHLTKTYPDHPWGVLVRFMCWTGLRTGEVSGLNVGDVDLMHSTLHVRRTRSVRGGLWSINTPKSGKARTVPLMPWVKDDLTAYLATHPGNANPDAPLWPGTRPGAAGGSPKTTTQRSGSLDFSSPWEATTFRRRRFKPALTAVGLPEAVRLHDCRHTFASLAASKGVPSAQVAKWLGHSSDVITREIYTHLFDADTSRHASDMGKGDRPRSIPSATVTPINAAG
jgi:integrase